MLQLQIVSEKMKKSVKNGYFITGSTLVLLISVAILHFGMGITVLHSSKWENLFYFSIISITTAIAFLMAIENNNYEEVGALQLDNTHIVITDDKQTYTYQISDIRLLNVRIMGYYGQELNKYTESKLPIEQFVPMKAGGYMNYISIKTLSRTHKYYFFLDSNLSAETFKRNINDWKKNTRVWLNEIN